MTDRIRWGIAATGGIANRMTDALATVPDAEVVAVGSRAVASASEFAGRHGIPRAHGSYDELFADPDVDIVYVASPHSHHHEMTLAALAAGKHVLCEKAFAVNATQAQEMIDAARTHDRFLMEAMWMWFIPAVVEVRNRVRDGEIGSVRVVEADFGLRILDEHGRHRRLDLAGGALLDLGIYPLSLATFLLGPPREVRAMGTVGPTGVDTTVAGVTTHDGDAFGVFHTSIDAVSGLGASVVGTEGRIDLHAPFWFANAFTVHPTDGEAQRVEIPNRGLAHEAQHAMQRIAGGHRESDVVPLSATVEMMRLLDEIRGQVGVVYPEDRRDAARDARRDDPAP